MSSQPILVKTYTWEEMCDVDRDMSELLDYPPFDHLPGEFTGEIEITVRYLDT